MDPLFQNLIHHPPINIVFEEIPIHVRDGVFSPDPSYSHSSLMILRYTEDVKGKSILDLGCGTGALAIWCAKKGAFPVVASDISSTAIQNTLENVEKNKLTDRVTVIESDLFENLSQPFDIILANLPISDELWGEESNPYSIIEKFLRDAPRFIVSGGRLLLAWGSFADIGPVTNAVNSTNKRVVIHKEDVLGHSWYVFEIFF